MVGRLSVRGLRLHVNRQRLALGDDGWELLGFVGSEGELRRQLLLGHETAAARHVLLGSQPQVGRAAHLLRDHLVQVPTLST